MSELGRKYALDSPPRVAKSLNLVFLLTPQYERRMVAHRCHTKFCKQILASNGKFMTPCVL